MIIDKTAFEACLTHLIAEARIGMEGVGLLSGPIRAPAVRAPGLLSNQQVTSWTPLANTAEFPRFRYETDPGELLAAYNALEGAGLRPAVLVHSHLTGGAAPSASDVRYAADPALLHMIVDLAARSPHVALWLLDPERPPEAQLRVRHQVADLLKQKTSAGDLTHDVTGG